MVGHDTKVRPAGTPGLKDRKGRSGVSAELRRDQVDLQDPYPVSELNLIARSAVAMKSTCKILPRWPYFH